MDLYSVTTVLLVILVTILLTKYTKILLEKSKLPPGPTPLPIIGTLHKMNFNNIVKSLLDLLQEAGNILARIPIMDPRNCITKLEQTIEEWHLLKKNKGLQSLSKKYGDIYTVYEGSQPVIVLCNYKTIKDTLIDKAEEFSGRAYFPSFFDFTKGDDFAFSSGEKWKELRRFAMLTLGSLGVGKRSFEERIREEAMCLTDVLRKSNGSSIDPNYNILRAMSNVICSVVFGNRFEYNDEHFQKLVLCVQDNFRIMSTRWGLLYNIFPNVMRYIPGPHHEIMENFKFMGDFIKTKMENNMKTLDRNNPRDFIDCFLIKMEKEKNNEKTFYNPDTLVMCSFDLFFGGTGTVSETLKFTLLFLMKHPSVAAKVYSEIDSVIGQRPPHYEDRHSMPYTVAFLYEIQRYADVTPLALPHELTMDTQIYNYKFKKGTVFTPVLTSAHNDKTQFDNPENFDPKHFLDENGKLIKNEALMPFSAGKRICPGKSLADMEIFLFITTLLQKFTIKSPVPPEKISVTPAAVGLGHISPSYEICFLPRTCTKE